MLQRLARILLFVSVAFSIASVARNLWQAYAPRRPGGVARCDRAEFKFGDLFTNSTVEHEFVIANVGAAPLKIERVQAECGCTALVRDIANESIAPRRSLSVPVRMNLGSQVGPVRKRLVVLFAGSPRQTLVLFMAGNVRLPYALSQYRVNFGVVSPGRPARAKTIIEPAAGYPAFELLGVFSNSRFVGVTAQRSPGGSATIVNLEVRPPLPAGRHSATVFLRTSDPTIGTISIPVSLIASAQNDDSRAAHVRQLEVAIPHDNE